MDGSIWFEDTLYFSAISKELIWKWIGKSYIITILHEAYKLNPILLQIQTDITLRQNLVS
jgi:hypothetical protein